MTFWETATILLAYLALMGWLAALFQKKQADIWRERYEQAARANGVEAIAKGAGYLLGRYR